MKLSAQFKSGRLTFTDPVGLTICAQEYGEKPLEVDIQPVRKIRSKKQNARYWTIIVPLVQHCVNRRREGLPPLNPKQVHAVIVTAFLGTEDTPLGPVPMTTHDRDTKTFNHLTEQATLWLGEQGYHVPLGREESVAEAIAEAME